jgi:hypothetical protein
MGREWVRQFVPGGCYLGVVHDDREHLHLHLVLRNESVLHFDCPANFVHADFQITHAVSR